MLCPKCGSKNDKVIDSRPWKDGATIRRRRECLDCSHRFTTYEVIEREDLRVIKRDGRYEPFDRRKMLQGISRACEKRPVSKEAIEVALDRIITRLEEENGREIPSNAIGEAIMSTLREMDEVAYIRFASVYRQFRDVREFIEEVQNIQPQERKSA